MKPTNVLLVKLSSLGDVIHTFAAVTDVKRRFPDVTLTWAVEEAIAPLLSGQANVDRVIVAPLRRLRKQRRLWWRDDAYKAMRADLREASFSHVLDAQGLLKSALLTRLAGSGKRIGYDMKSAREGLASCFYQQRIAVKRSLHAVTRTRRLFAQAFDYTIDERTLDFGLSRWSADEKARHLFFFHGTTWASKLLPESTWRELIHFAARDGYRVLLTWGNTGERERAERLCAGNACATVLPAMTLPEIRERLRKSHGAISVDTGLGHLAAALGVPTLGVFGPTDPALAGMRGAHAHNLARPSPCLRRHCRQEKAARSPCCMAGWRSTAIWSAFRRLRENTNA